MVKIPNLELQVVQLEALQRAQKQALDCWNRGVLVLGSDSRILTMNRMAEEILRKKKGLELREGMLRASSQEVASKLKELSRLTESRGSKEQIGHISIAQRTGERPLILEFHRLRSDCPTWIVFITDANAMLQPNAHLMKTLFQLTDAETKLAALLAQGYDMRTICKEFDVALNTGRTHLKRLFYKTNTGRQADLVRLMLSISSA